MKSLASLGLLLALVAGPAFAQTAPGTEAEPDPAAALKALQADVGPEKRAFVEQQLGLDEAQAKAFWPVYDAHQYALAELNERRLNNIEAYAAVWNAETTDDKALSAVAAEALAIEKDEAALLARTYGKLKGKVPVATAVRYLQLENKLRALIKVELAASIPFAK